MENDLKPAEFKAWRKGRALKQKDAAELLGLKKRVIQYYEKGKRDGKAVEIPLTVELACWAILQGIGGFDGKDTRPLTIANPTEEVAAAPVEADATVETAEVSQPA